MRNRAGGASGHRTHPPGRPTQPGSQKGRLSDVNRWRIGRSMLGVLTFLAELKMRDRTLKALGQDMQG